MHRENLAFTRENPMKLIKFIDAQQAKTVYSSKNINEKLLETNAAIQFDEMCCLFIFANPYSRLFMSSKLIAL
jgi:hypothetical protein